MSNDRNLLLRPAILDPHGDGDDSTRRRVSRRGILIGGASAAGGLAAATLARPAAFAQDATPVAHDMAGMTASPPTNEGYTYFVPYQAAIVRAAAARLIPTDDLGPGATEAGVVYFIDREMSSAKTYFGHSYQQGPFREGTATQGDQSALDMADRFRLGIEGMDLYAQQLYGQGFANLTAEQQDRILSDMQQGIPDTFDGASIQAAPFTLAPSGTEAAIATADDVGVGAKAFFNLLLTYTVAGFFSDPVHGGNRDMVGWKLIGFPGAHISYRDQILNYGQPFTGPFISLGQYQQQVSGGE